MVSFDILASRKAVLFDLDGLLVDSEPIHFEAYRRLFEEYDITLTRQMFIDSWLGGKHYGTRYYLGRLGLSEEEIARARDRKSKLFLEIAEGQLECRIGAQTLLKKLNEKSVLCGIGTGGYREEYEFIVRECGLESYVGAVVGGDEVPRNKPAPDIFLAVAERLGAEPNECLVFENSSIGLEAALAAQMPCVVVPSEFTVDQDFGGAHAILENLSELRAI